MLIKYNNDNGDDDDNYHNESQIMIGDNIYRYNILYE